MGYPRGVGVVTRHARTCPRSPCRCDPSFQAWVFENGRKRRRTFVTFDDAAAWRADQLAAGTASPGELVRRMRQARADYEAAAGRVIAAAQARRLA